MKAKYEQEQVKDYILTYGGGKFYVADPRVEDVNIEDIAHALSQLVRYTGHTRHKFYSVAEHSFLCSSLAGELGMSYRIQLIALLHDASEAYCNDLNRPLKQTLPDYKVAEDRVSNVIWDAFDIHPTEEEYKIIKKLDNTLLVWEMKQLMYAKKDEIPDVEYYDEVEALDITETLSMNLIEFYFLITYKELSEEYAKEKNY